MKYKLIVSDFDDTFIKDDHTYSKDLVDTVHRYIDKGGKFMIATGRMIESIRPACIDIGLKGEVIGFQGAVIADIESGTELLSHPIEWEKALEIAKWVEKKGYYYHIYNNDNFIVKRVTFQTRIYLKYAKTNPIRLRYPLSKYIEENKFSPIKMMILARPNMVDKIIDEMTREFGETMLFNTSKKWIVEMINKKTDKGKAVSWVADRHKIKREEIICIGDSANDVAMIKYAGLGVVVENGSDYAKKYADIIAPSNENEGVSYIIKKYGLEEE